MHLAASAIILSSRAHGESGAVVRALTPADGVRPGYVRGGHGRRLRPVLQPGNSVLGEWRARTEAQLPALTVELARSRAASHADPAAAAALEWLTALTAATLPEAQPYPRLHAGLDAVLDLIEAAFTAQVWAPAIAGYEQLLLAELGFGLDLATCAVTGETDSLAFVSPRSGRAVSVAGAMGYESRLLPLPAFLREGGSAGWADVFAGLAITGRFLDRDLLHDRRTDLLAARNRLLDRLRRAAG